MENAPCRRTFHQRESRGLRYHTSAHSPGAALGPTTVPGGISKSVGDSFFNDVERLALVVRRQTAQISMANTGLAKVGLFLRGTTLRGSIFLGSGPTLSGLLQVLELRNSRVLCSDEVGDVLDPIFRDRCSCVLGLCYCHSSQLSSATMFRRFAHCRTATTFGLICNIAPLPCCGDSHTPMLRVCLFRYQAVRLPPVSVFTTLVPQSRSGEQRPCCSHCVSRVACRLRARVVVVEPPTAS